MSYPSSWNQHNPGHEHKIKNNQLDIDNQFPVNWVGEFEYNSFYVQNAQCKTTKWSTRLEEIHELFTKNPIANKLSPQSLHHFLQQGEVYRKQAEHPTDMALQLSCWAFHANHLWWLSPPQPPEHFQYANFKLPSSHKQASKLSKRSVHDDHMNAKHKHEQHSKFWIKPQKPDLIDPNLSSTQLNLTIKKSTTQTQPTWT